MVFSEIAYFLLLFSCYVQGDRIIVGNTPIKATKNNLLTTIPKWGPEYEINFDIKIDSNSVWGSFLRFTATDGDSGNGKEGKRIPALWARRTDIAFNTGKTYNPVQIPGLGIWFNVKIQQVL